MGVLDWLYGDKPKTAAQAKTGSVEKAAMQLSEKKKRMRQAECARQQKEYDIANNKCV